MAWLIVALALAASLFRFAIARYSLWFDEQASLFFAEQPWARLWSDWMVREPNPPLYYGLLKGWIMVFGDGQRAVRSLSIVAGAGSIVTTAIFTAQVYGRKAGIIAALLTALSAQQLYYSLQVRGYELAYFAASCGMISLVSIERDWRRGRVWPGSLAGYAAGCTACIYLHTTMFLLPVICTIAILLVHHRLVAARPTLMLGLMTANLSIALATGWWLRITAQQMSAGPQDFGVFDIVTPWMVLTETIGVLTFARETGPFETIVAVPFALLALFQIGRRWAVPETKLLVAVLGTAVMAFATISIATPIFLPRTIFWLSAIGTALCAAGIAAIKPQPLQWLVAAGLGAALVSGMVAGAGVRQTEDWDNPIRRAASVPGARLIVQGEAMGLLLATACARHRSPCPVPIIVVTTPEDRLDPWSHTLYPGRTVAIKAIATLPPGPYFVFRKAYYHDLIKTLHRHGRARSIRMDPPLLGPVDRAALVD